MSAVGTLVDERLMVHVDATEAVRADVVAKLTSAGIGLAEGVRRSPGTVTVAAARTVDEALDACHPACRSAEHRVLVVADVFSPSGVRRAVQVGVRAMLRATGTTPAQFRVAVRSADHGDGRLPHEVLLRLLDGRDEQPPPPVPARAATPSPLTPRQTVVLTLMAEGHANAEIARALSCSEHTVKNVIYDLMARLQVRNRSHAVACAVRSGLV